MYVYYSARYPPYSEKKINILNFLLAKRKGISLKPLAYLMMFVCGVGATVVFRAIAKVKTNDWSSLSYLFFKVPFKPVIPTHCHVFAMFSMLFVKVLFF
jgi:hypothetical protein